MNSEVLWVVSGVTQNSLRYSVCLCKRVVCLLPNKCCLQDKEWVQLGAPNTNRNRPGINPNFPAYPSGHATFGTSAFMVTKQELNIPGTR